MGGKRRGFLKRLYIKTMIWWRKKTDTKFEFDNEHQERAIYFVERMLRHNDSNLIFTSSSDTFYIENSKEEVHVIIHKRFIGIVNSEYNSDAIISDKLYEVIRAKFEKRVKQNHEKSRDKLQDKQKEILKKIYDKHNIENGNK